MRALVLAGLNVARLNFSHGTHADHAAIVDDIRKIASELDVPVAVLQDLPGPKVRTGPHAEGVASVHLEKGSPFFLSTTPVVGSVAGVFVNYAGLARDVEIGKRVYLADGAIALRIVRKDDERIETLVEVGGDLRGQQGINYPDGTLQIAAVTDRDFEHLAFGLDIGVDLVAISFVKSAEDVLRVKAFIAERGKNVPVIAKIEKHEALENIDAIIDAADAIMVARGDLGIEIPLERVPMVQKDLIARANRVSKPVITATQMLESMISAARPTRAEATDVANAIIDGTDAVMLSGETARGAYPIEAVSVMATIAREIEASYPHEVLRFRRMAHVDRSIETTIAEGAAQMAEELELGYIVTGRQYRAPHLVISAARAHHRDDADSRGRATHVARVGRGSDRRRYVSLLRNAHRYRRSAYATREPRPPRRHDRRYVRHSRRRGRNEHSQNSQVAVTLAIALREVRRAIVVRRIFERCEAAFFGDS
jgi:pyruvate kinase